MATIDLTPIGMIAGVWQARVSADGEPQIEVTHDGRTLDGVALQEQGAGTWLMQVPVPSHSLSDGLQTYLVTDRVTGTSLGYFTILAGDPLDEDLRAEIALLRAELDMLKKAFRRLASGD